MDFPVEFCRRMESLLGKDAPLFFASLEEEPRRSFRYDPKKVKEEELREYFGEDLREAIPFGKNAFRFTASHIGAHPLHHGGALYVQEPAAMAPVFSLGERSFDSILDLCAAPGGKSLQAASLLLSEDGLLVCNEPMPPRLKALMQNVERLSEKRAVVTSFDATSLPEELEKRFDLVICDVPCSGEGMMRKNEEAVSRWSLDHILECAARQEKILESAALAVKDGGVILYSTCTFAPEENEEILSAFLKKHEEFILEEATDEVIAVSRPGIGEGMEKARRFYPHVFSGEGQFLAILKNTLPAGERKEIEKNKKEKNRKNPKTPPEIGVAQEFLKESLGFLPEEEIFLRGEEVYLLPKKAKPLAAETVSPGVLLGQVRKGRLVPHHRFFMAYYESMKKAPLTLEMAEAYLRGEEISPVAGEGWQIAMLGNCPLGGVKVGGGKGKNHYPKGLRKV